LPDWIIASADGRATAGQRFELLVIAPPNEEPPAELQLRIKSAVVEERTVVATAVGVPTGAQRVYVAEMPSNVLGPVSIELAGRSSSVLSLVVAATPDPDALRALTGAYGQPGAEPPLSENDPMYFVIGARDGWSAH